MRSEWPITAGVNNTTNLLKLKVNTRHQHQARENSCDQVKSSQFVFFCFR